MCHRRLKVGIQSFCPNVNELGAFLVMGNGVVRQDWGFVESQVARTRQQRRVEEDSRLLLLKCLSLLRPSGPQGFSDTHPFKVLYFHDPYDVSRCKRKSSVHL